VYLDLNGPTRRGRDSSSSLTIDDVSIKSVVRFGPKTFDILDFVFVGVETDVHVRRLLCCCGGDDTFVVVPTLRRCRRIRREGVAGTCGEDGIDTAAAVALT
jgi:hypothetical protein